MLWSLLEDGMAAACVGNGLVRWAGHCCHPATLDMDNQCAWGQAPSLASHPTLFCLVGAWGKGWSFPYVAVLDMMGLILVGTSWSPRRRYVNREPGWRKYVSTSWEILILVLGIINPESSCFRVSDEEIKSPQALQC